MQGSTLGYAVVWEVGFWESHAGKNFWIYMIGPLLASCVAPAMYFALYGTTKAPMGKGGEAIDVANPNDRL